MSVVSCKKMRNALSRVVAVDTAVDLLTTLAKAQCLDVLKVMRVIAMEKTEKLNTRSSDVYLAATLKHLIFLKTTES